MSEHQIELIKKTKAQVELFLSYLLNAHEDGTLPSAIKLFKQDYQAGASRIVPLHPDMPQAKAIRGKIASSKLPFMLFSKRAQEAAVKRGEVKVLRLEPQKNDYQCGTYYPSLLERERCRIIPCSRHKGFVEVKLNNQQQLVIQSFSSRAYKDIAGAEGFAMYVMLEDGSFYVGTRRWFPSKPNEEPAFFHSSLNEGKPVVSAGLLATGSDENDIMSTEAYRV
ncbi:hypothetical protein [Legionella sp. 16cNR16C]|uniref:hypothetical protein n=1 Tax=Legionella sp. 16cNR16C TaxID=2905656 RepID=UPI001E4F6F24|nr:hypothetical protein [Legionella sp. 16cNR16C]MCE3044185.1 hypothetical protein [Legionella sp. 16cNR16C]